ncbi:hypothetical protein OG800_50750 (plasmid) [Streptomyces sp. NBC_00445]|uniref:hypothetical protein n=1 Tax=Streptomyces sp. NBC_00445 TaxID=2975745 RepID=UPI002E1E49C5
MERVLARAGYGDAEYSVRRGDTLTTAACWSWVRGYPELNSEEWPAGLDLEWNSSGGWSFRARGDDRLVALPVPVLAAPQAIVALLPGLMDGRRGQLPASEDRWEHAAAIVSCVEAASVYGDDKYGADYQRAEEEAATFLRWQAQLDGAVPADELVQSSAEGSDAEVSTAADTGVGNSRPREPEAGELARRTHVNVILDAAVKASRDGGRPLPPELFGILTDFFTRAVVFPGQLDLDDGHLHTSDPSRALARYLLQHLERHGLDLEEVPEMELPESSVAPAGDAMVECVAQTLRASRWFSSAAAAPASTGPAGGRVAFRTVFGAEGVLDVTVSPG